MEKIRRSGKANRQSAQSKEVDHLLRTVNAVLDLEKEGESEPEPSESRILQRGCRELLLLGRLLDKCYIHSTDIEYAQFYNKELALRVEQWRLELLQTGNKQFQDLEESTVKAFAQMELKKSHYFKENAMEMSQSAHLLRSLNLNLKDENDGLQDENVRLKRAIAEMGPRLAEMSGKCAEGEETQEKMETEQMEMQERLWGVEREMRLKEGENMKMREREGRLELVERERERLERRVVDLEREGVVQQRKWAKQRLGLEADAQMLKLKCEKFKRDRKQILQKVIYQDWVDSMFTIWCVYLRR